MRVCTRVHVHPHHTATTPYTYTYHTYTHTTHTTPHMYTHTSHHIPHTLHHTHHTTHVHTHTHHTTPHTRIYTTHHIPVLPSSLSFSSRCSNVLPTFTDLVSSFKTQLRCHLFQTPSSVRCPRVPWTTTLMAPTTLTQN